MEKRDALNYLGQKIGEIEFPDGTPEHVWAAKLAIYAKPPPDQSAIQYEMDRRSIKEKREFLDDLMERTKIKFKEEGMNPMQGFWIFNQARKLTFTWMGVEWCINTFDLYHTGNVELLTIAMKYTEPDDFSQPYHWWTRERLDWIVNECKIYLGWA